MTTNNEAFEKWYKNSTNLLAHGAPVYHSLKDAWQAATTEANKRMAELESEVAELKCDYLRMQGSAARISIEYLELQSSNNRLREALENIKNCPTWAIGVLEADKFYTLLQETPAESLQAHDDELIEDVISVIEKYRGFSGLEVIEAIRARKEVK